MYTKKRTGTAVYSVLTEIAVPVHDDSLSLIIMKILFNKSYSDLQYYYTMLNTEYRSLPN